MFVMKRPSLPIALTTPTPPHPPPTPPIAHCKNHASRPNAPDRQHKPRSYFTKINTYVRIYKNENVYATA